MLVEKSLIETIYSNRMLIWRLSLAQARDRYSATVLGSAWAIFHPALTLLVFWFVFEFGLRLPQSGPIPFFLSLIVGLAAWLVFNDGLLTGLNAVTSNSHLVKKISFPLEILPIIPVVAAFTVHFFIMALVVVITCVNGYWPGRSIGLIIYYSGAMAFFIVGLIYLLSALNVFHRDIGHMASMLIQLCFWLTPIVWSPEVFSPGVRAVLEYNPMHHIVMGYRDVLLLNNSSLTLASVVRFWIIVLPITTVGVMLFRRLKYDFADIL